MSVNVGTSAQLVWAIANTEANLAGDNRIRPIHFFLGVLKLIDPHFLKQLQGVELPADEQIQLGQQSLQARHYLEMSVDKVTQLRRSIRAELRVNKGVRADMRMLHRSNESRTVFQTAAEKAVQSGASLSVLHLVASLFETGYVSLDNLKNSKACPSANGARREVVKDNDHHRQERFAEWFGRNLSRLAAEGKLPPFAGRETEIRLLMRILSRTNKRHIAILGGPGGGKTALVEGLANALITTKEPEALKHCEILELHGSDIASDCATEAELSCRLSRLFNVLGSHKTAVLLLDNFYGLFPGHLKPEAAFALLTTILAEDSTPCIVTTTIEQWSVLTDNAPSMARLFQIIKLTDPSRADCHSIAKIWAKRIADLQKITFAPEALAAILKAANDLPGKRSMPDGIVDLLENAATFVKVSALSSKSGHTEVSAADVVAVLSEHYGISPERARRCISEL